MADLSSSAGDRPTQFLPKTCSKCHVELPLEAFSRSARGLYGRRGDCKSCHAAHKAAARLTKLDEHRSRARDRYAANPDASRAATVKWREANRQKDIERDRSYKAANRELLRQRDRERIARDPEHHRQKSKRYRESHPERVREAVKKWQDRNPEKIREIDRRRRSTAKGRVTNAIRAAVHRGLIKGGKNGLRTFDCLGFSLQDLMTHLEGHFLLGMTWDNYGSDWHIDHVIPLSAFNYETTEHVDFQRAWSLSNLRPLWACDNLKKHAKLSAPFQPSLLIP